MGQIDVSIQLGRFFLHENSYDLAIEILSKAIASDPQSALAYDLRGMAYGHQEKYAQSILDFTRAIENDGPGQVQDRLGVFLLMSITTQIVG